MKRANRFPTADRPAIARRALEIFEREPNRARGLYAVIDALGVSNPTARNLVSYGRYLRRQEEAA